MLFVNILTDCACYYSTLPQLMEQKRCVDMHMHIATYLAKEIKNRQLDLLNDVEDKLITLQSLQVSEGLFYTFLYSLTISIQVGVCFCFP